MQKVESATKDAICHEKTNKILCENNYTEEEVVNLNLMSNSKLEEKIRQMKIEIRRLQKESYEFPAQ